MPADQPGNDWPKQVIDPYRELLAAQYRSLGERIEQAKQRCDDVDAAATAEVDALTAKIPEIGEQPTDVEYLTMRAAQADRDLAAAGHDVASSKAWLAVQLLHVERNEIDLRIGQIDHLTEQGPAAAGNDDQLAILMLDVKEASFEQAGAATSVEFARQRLALTKTMHRDIHAALRKVQRAAGQGAK